MKVTREGNGVIRIELGEETAQLLLLALSNPRFASRTRAVLVQELKNLLDDDNASY